LLPFFYFKHINNTMSNNYLNPTSFVLSLDSTTYPAAEFTVQTMILPDVTSDGAVFNTPSRSIAVHADKIVYGQFDCSFLIDEDLINYKEIYDWLYQQVDSDGSHTRDLTLSILSSANNVTKQIRFIDAFPTNLSALPFDITMVDVEYLTAVVTFNYSYFEIV
jgi:hypothetical protein